MLTIPREGTATPRAKPGALASDVRFARRALSLLVPLEEYHPNPTLEDRLLYDAVVARLREVAGWPAACPGHPTDSGPPVNPPGPRTGPGHLRPPGGQTQNVVHYHIDKIVIDGSKSAREIVRVMVDELDTRAASTGGAGSSRATALEYLRR